ncbi:MAG: MFS transporter, partial [Lachnospiraceae bacterium]|nr:MFS transporter [Lachnospiraceae bacterium]
YGRYGEKIDLTRYMLGSGVLCLVCYLLASVSHNPMLSLAGCILCGFSVGIMWPGTISILSKRMSKGGTAMFAFLAMAGDLGGSIGPALVGYVSQQANDSIQMGLLAGSIFPVILIISVFVIMRRGGSR